MTGLGYSRPAAIPRWRNDQGPAAVQRLGAFRVCAVRPQRRPLLPYWCYWPNRHAALT